MNFPVAQTASIIRTGAFDARNLSAANLLAREIERRTRSAVPQFTAKGQACDLTFVLATVTGLGGKSPISDSGPISMPDGKPEEFAISSGTSGQGNFIAIVAGFKRAPFWNRFVLRQLQCSYGQFEYPGSLNEISSPRYPLRGHQLGYRPKTNSYDAWDIHDWHQYICDLGVPSLLFDLLISSFPALLGLILSPVISVRSDRHRGNRGRRIPLLLITTPPAVFGMIGLGLTLALSETIHQSLASERPAGDWLQRVLGSGATGDWLIGQVRNEYVVAMICFCVFWSACELATITSQAVFGGLINDVVPAQLLGRFYGFFRAVSLIDGMIFNKLVYGHVNDHFTLILVIIGIF